MKKLLAVSALSMLLLGTQLTPAAAQLRTDRFSLGFSGSIIKMVLGESDRSTVDQWASIQVKYGFSPRIAFALNGGYGWVRPRDPNGSHFAASDPFKTLLMPVNVNVHYTLFPEQRATPYFSLGAGTTEWDIRDVRGQVGTFDDGHTLRGSVISGTLIGGVGVEAFWTDFLASHVDFRFHRLLKDDEDTIGTGDGNKGIVELRFGLNYCFGGFLDRDQDGVEDKYDACPDESEDFDNWDDDDGCPELDNDGDGVADVNDKCPNSAEDFDGFQDNDGCPDLDNDGDGVRDDGDACPDQAEDMDGFMDDDGCPDPDNDGDGFPDEKDGCPSEAETWNEYQDSDGCPDERPPVIEKGAKVILRGVNFESGSAQLLPQAYPILDEVYESLAGNPEVEVEIRGHTDSQGSRAYNQRLSEKRAESVKLYLVNRGVDAARIAARGYGEDVPIATNSTSDGRAANRRIEFARTK